MADNEGIAERDLKAGVTLRIFRMAESSADASIRKTRFWFGAARTSTPSARPARIITGRWPTG